jgi:photosystem II stability/assembly factor-like uncharacterized protein
MKNSTDIRKSLWIFGIAAIVLVGFTSLPILVWGSPILVWGSDKEVRLAEDTAIASLSGVLSTNSTPWTTEGPFGGYINSLTLATTNPDIIYAGTDGGLFKTIDSGHIWTKTSFPEMVVRVVQVVPDNPDIVYAGTTDDGIYKSEDGGDTWTQKGLSGARVNAIAIDPINPYTLYAGAGGIYKSTDGGETWQLKYSEGEVAALIIDADIPSYIYAGINIMDRPGLRKSTDGGETWVSIKVGNLSTDNVVALAMTPAGSTPSVIYAVNSVDADVFKSTDRGESWTRTNTPGISSVSPWALAVDPNNPNVIYVGTQYNKGGLYKSTDGGNTWSIEVKGLPYACHSSIVINPRNSTVYAGLSNGGVYKSKDMGESWNFSSHGMNNTWIEALAVHPTSSDTVFAGIKGKGHHLAKTTNGGTSWDCLVNSPTNIQAIAIDPQTPSTLFVGRDESVYIYNSTDGGQSWVGTRLIRVIGGRPVFGVSDIWINPTDSNIIMTTVDHQDAGVFRSTDGGVSWTRTHVCKATTLAADPNESQCYLPWNLNHGVCLPVNRLWV